MSSYVPVALATIIIMLTAMLIVMVMTCEPAKSKLRTGPRPIVGQSTLPPDKHKHLISDMLPGDIGYVVPWAIQVGPDRKMWISPAFPVHDNPSGTAHVMIGMPKSKKYVHVEASSISDDDKYISGHLSDNVLPIKMV